MNITDELIDKVAKLCKLEFKGSERAHIIKDFQRMLDFVDQLQEVDTQGVEPLVHMTEEVNHLRQDRAEGSLKQEEALKNSPQPDEAYFRVPKVIED